MKKLTLFCCRLISLPSSQPEMSIICYLSLSLSSLGEVHVGTAAYTSCLERGGEGENKTTAKKSMSLFLYGPMTKTSCQTLLGAGRTVQKIPNSS